MISFRTRLFIIAARIVSAVLIAVLVLAWSSIMKNQVDQLDERLCRETQRITTQPFLRSDVLRLEADMVAKLRLSGNEQLLLRYTSETGMPEIKSTHWKDALAIDKLVWKKSAFREIIGLERMPRDARPPHLEHELDPLPPRDRAPRGNCQHSAFTLQDTEWRAALFTTPRGKGFIAADLAATKTELQAAFKQALWLVVPLAFTLTALGAWLLASLTMRPVNRLRNTMKNLTKNELDQRLSSIGEDKEFKELINTYNTMLQRLEASFHQATRFSGDAAHELRTPLTILQGRIEQALNKPDNQALQTDLTSMLDEVGRLTAITRKLLLLSHADAGKLALHYTQINLTGLLKELVDDIPMLARDHVLTSRITEAQFILADTLLLRQLFNNLISNAARYCPPKGSITIESCAEENGVAVIISNTSTNITPEERLRFFERFYRGNPAHNRHTEGNGLGLSLALEIAKAHDGDLRLQPSASDIVSFRLWLPFK
jgi:two-component system heavy metal sensor histidine kinase CusS